MRAVELLLATGNAHKVVELRALLEPMGIGVLVPSDVGGLPTVDEDGESFASNAERKARAAARAVNRWCLADDSGLEVDRLGGAPGVHSARYAGEHGDAGANNARLLAELEGVPEEQRGARFVCALALARPDGEIECVVEGEACGRILEAPRGDGGFGYDPLFLFTEPGHSASGTCFAELTLEEKDAVSHRGRASRALVERLNALPNA